MSIKKNIIENKDKNKMILAVKLVKSKNKTNVFTFVNKMIKEKDIYVFFDNKKANKK
ncbi:hypothetical protein [Blattabacterium cuenoti]|uniref:hypothetical protein n=1 Tax=Blattabacterium cuenoti TaxID=1653831 RepID=UPI00163C1E87|nr:hypothetical protein [Blattabacterium cuenoti]